MSDLMEVKLSERVTVKVKEMTMTESIMADGIAAKFATKLGEDFPSVAILGKVYSVCSIREYNGVPENPVVSFTAFTNMTEKITVQEGTALLMAVSSLMGGEAGDASLKNEPAPSV